MMKISSAVRTGAMAFLRREFKIVIPVAIALAIIIGFASSFSNGVVRSWRFALWDRWSDFAQNHG